MKGYYFGMMLALLNIQPGQAQVNPECIRQEFDGISYALYKASSTGGQIIWTEQHKQDFILDHNTHMLTDISFSTNTDGTARPVADGDFIPCDSNREQNVLALANAFNRPLRARAWYVPVLKKEGIIKFLEDPQRDKNKAPDAVKMNGVPK